MASISCLSLSKNDFGTNKQALYHGAIAIITETPNIINDFESRGPL